MPPKKKVAERGDELETERDTPEITSPISSASSYSTASSASTVSAGTVSSEQLELILAANSKSMEASMTAIVAALTPPVHTVSAPKAQIKVPRWTDEETPSEYFNKFEKALTHNGVGKETWGHLLPVYLAGKAQAAFAQVEVSALADYERVKATLLESLGDTPACADRKWWTLNRQTSEEPGQFYLRVRATGLRRLAGFNSRDEVVEQVILSRFMSLLPSECYSAVVSKQPKSGLEAARMVKKLEPSPGENSIGGRILLIITNILEGVSKMVLIL